MFNYKKLLRHKLRFLTFVTLLMVIAGVVLSATAATFDSDLLPDVNGTVTDGRSIGQTILEWKNLFISGFLSLGSFAEDPVGFIGSVYYNTTNSKPEIYNGTVWEHISQWILGAANSIYYNTGSISVGTSSPGSALDVKGTLRLSGVTSGYIGFTPAAVAGAVTYILPSNAGVNGQILLTNGVDTLRWGVEGWLAAGTNGAVQFNNSGVLSGNASGFFWDNSNGRLGIGTSAPGSAFEVFGTNWTSGNSLPSGRNLHTSVATNNFLYVIGGSGSSAVSYASLNADGTVGTWNATTSLPGTIMLHGSVIANGYVYVVGGWGSSAVYYALINGDGTVGTWNTTTSLPVAGPGADAVTANGYMYVAGSGTNPQSTVYYAPINGNGTLGAWNTTTVLPSGRWNNSTIATSSHVYVIAGSSGGLPPHSTVYYAPINGNGTLGAWGTTTALPVAVWRHASVILNGNIYIMGGDDGSNYNSTVYYAPINGNGTLGAWGTTTDLPRAFNEHSSAVANNHIYITGGNDGGTLSTIYYSTSGQSLFETVPSTSDIYTPGVGNGLILKSPNGFICKRLGINDAGAVTTTTVDCP